MARKNSEPAIQFNGEKLTPDEFDQDQQYVIMNPSVDPAFVGTVAGTQTQSVALVAVNARLDYPRNLVYAIAAASGSARGGALTVNGKDQFGSSVTETVSISPANGGGTVSGTQVFGAFTSGTANFGTGDPGPGTARLGVGIGTSATIPLFGLPAKLGGTADVKRITWLDADTAKMHTAAAAANVAQSAVILNVAGGIAAADSFVVTYRSSFAVQEGNVFKT